MQVDARIAREPAVVVGLVAEEDLITKFPLRDTNCLSKVHPTNTSTGIGVAVRVGVAVDVAVAVRVAVRVAVAVGVVVAVFAGAFP